MVGLNRVTDAMLAVRPAVVAVGYNRPDALLRLLSSLRAGSYPGGVPLVVSLDWSGDPGPGEIADAFDWPHGPKRVIRHPQQLGLRTHILACGDLTRDYGGIVLFEDDIVAAPHYYDYVLRAMARYDADPRIGGIALYGYRLNEFNNMDFEPIDDGHDVYFLQVAASWGQAWTAAQWNRFREWYSVNSAAPIRVADRVPRQLESWRENSWKRFYIKYLTATDRTFVYPRASLATNSARPGTNTKRDVSIYQVPMDLRRRDWRLCDLDASTARYDVFYEPDAATVRALQPSLENHDFDVDLFGTKPREALTRPSLLSSRGLRWRVRAQASFGLLAGAPPIGSIALGLEGTFFSCARREAFGAMTPSRRLALIRATQVGRARNALMFQTLKPIQTELMIRRQRSARAHGA